MNERILKRCDAGRESLGMAKNKKNEDDSKKPKYVDISVLKASLGFTTFPATIKKTILDVDFTLLDNAISSLEEGIKKFLEGKEADEKAFKFSVLHIAHFIELFFKYYVWKQHPLLVYSNQHKPINDDSNTVTTDQAIQILKNCGIHLEKNIESDIEGLKLIRNRIEHFEFKLDVKETEKIIGKLIYDLILFDSKNFDTKLNERLEPNLWEKLHELSEAHESKVKLVEAEAERLGGDNIFICFWCGYETQVISEDGKLATCLFCSNKEIMKWCDHGCENYYPISHMTEWNEEYDDYMCEDCYEDFMRMVEKDD